MCDSASNIPQDFWVKLEEKYKALPHGEEAWNAEHNPLKQIVPSIADALLRRGYRILEPVGIGGVGIITTVMDQNLEVPRALKFARPVAGRESLLAELVGTEISRLREAVHPNIIEIYSKGKIPWDEVECPFYIMQFIPGAQDAHDFFGNQDRTGSDLVGVIKQTIEGLSHLHSLDVIHGDIKPENILVAPDKRTVISDLGSARSLYEGPETTLVIFTREYAHDALIAKAALSTSTDPNRIRGQVKRSELKKAFDLYALGKSILRLLSFFDPAERRRLDPYTRKYLHLMACRLLDGQNTDDECALGLPRTAFEEIKYTDISDVLTDIKKITGEYSLYQVVPEMIAHGSRTIQTSSLWPTPLTPRLSDTISHPALRRLLGVSQLGLAVHVYPTATHSRLEHVLGTFSNVVRYCDYLYSDPINPLFRQIITEGDLKTVLLAALCHDIGQYPLAHELEEVESDIFSHQEIAIAMLEGKANWIEAASLRRLISDLWGILPERVAGILKADPTNLKDPIKDRLLHTLIDGPIDADKLDYLVRDSVNLNVPFGRAIDFERLARCLTVVVTVQVGSVMLPEKVSQEEPSSEGAKEVPRPGSPPRRLQ